MQEKRKMKRRKLVIYLGVYAGESKIPLGFVADIHNAGIMLRCDCPIETKKTFSLRMELPQQIGIKKTHIDFSAESIWCEKEGDLDFYKAGFRLISADDELLGVINSLIRYFGSSRV
jgi:hypothetical protein